MKLAVVLALLLFAVAVTFWRPLRRVRGALGLDHLVSTGHVFLLLGCVLGAAFGPRSAPVADDLGPVVSFVAGWVGFATGMRFDLRILSRVPGRAFLVALTPAVAAATVCGGGSVALLLAAGAPFELSVAGSLVVAAASASSGPTLPAVLRMRRAGRASNARATLRMIEFSAGVDDLLVIVLAVLAFTLFQPLPEAVGSMGLIVFALGGGALLGGVTWLFLGGGANEDERLLLELGMLAFAAGFASWLYLSPASVSAVMAIVLVNLPGDRMELLVKMVRRVERPAVVILMSVIGLHVTGQVHWVTLPLIVLMTALRLLAKGWSGQVVAGPVPGAAGLHAASGWAYGLAPQGTLGLAVTLSFFYVWENPIARSVLAAVAFSSVINELAGPWLFLRLLRRISPHAAAGAEPREAS